MMKRICILWLAVVAAAPAWASGPGLDLPKNEKIWSTRDARWLTLAEWRRLEIQGGDVLVLGEQHAVGDSLSERVHQSNQLRLMTEVALDWRVSLGMEFFEYPKQDVVDRYTSGLLAEPDFLRDIGWGGNAWPLYREQVRLPSLSGGLTWALNIPRSISGRVGRSGPDSLSLAEKALLPPLWERGSDFYFERFAEVMRGHVSEQQLVNYFWAQSLWDDTMAWQASMRWLPRGQSASDEVFVIIAGQFHVEFGHALPARLIRHGLTRSGLSQVKTMVQIEVSEWSEAALAKAVAPHVRYGELADYVWVYELPGE
jgi:uncharacterized iron-regulated protein